MPFVKDIRRFWVQALAWVLIVSPICQAAQAGEELNSSIMDRLPPVEVHGSLDMRAGMRTQPDPHGKDASIMEARLQADLSSYMDWVEWKFKADVWADGISEEVEYDTREAWLFFRPSDMLDLKIGRQVLTWGTGDLVFVNDLFPKDWQSYFIGRNMEYLKAPSDAGKVSLFTDFFNLDVVYTPQFDPDRFITGEYISFWDAEKNGFSGEHTIMPYDEPDDWFEDDETAVRLFRNIANYELSLYGYWGFWKQPEGRTPSGSATFPPLHVYGSSVRGQVGRGIGNLELAYYDSTQDESGANPRVRNSEMRYLVGYSQDLAKDFNASLQYYVEQMLDYEEYTTNHAGSHIKDRERHVITLQLTKLLMNQNLELSLPTYCSPSDNDAYLRPNARYKYTDNLVLEAGANIFLGADSYTFFGQLENNTNIYGAINYSF